MGWAARKLALAALLAALSGEPVRGEHGTAFQLRDIRPGPAGSGVAADNGAAAVGGWVVFSADDGVVGQELWRTDGTPAGTELLADLIVGPAGSVPGSFFVAGSEVFFRAFLASGHDGLWKTDGTASGTVLVHDMGLGGVAVLHEGRAAVLGNMVVFPATSDETAPAGGYEMWAVSYCTDGVQTPDEQCDDGNRYDGDCCSSSCVTVPDAAPCADGSDCTTGDQCLAGVCIGSPAPDGDGDALCDPVDICPAVPNTGQADADADGVDDACDDCPAEANPDQRNSDGQGGGDVCDPCPLLAADTCNAAQSAGASIAAAGGTLTSLDNKVAVTIPADALSAPTSISMTESRNETVVGTSRVVFRTELGPDGLVFTSPVTLRFTWDDANGDGLIDGIQGSLFELRETNLRVWRNGVPLAGPCGSPAYQQPACATTCGGLRCCCDALANTWTLDVYGFSEYVVGDSEAMLLPGGRSLATDCVVEWEVSDPQETPAADRRGLPPTKRSCVDGDRLCDADGIANGTCAFRLRACVNVADERLLDRLGAPACAATDLSRVALKRPRPTDADPARVAAALALRDAFATLGPSTVGGAAGEVVTYAPPLSAAEACSNQTVVLVPLGGRPQKTLRVTTQARTSGSIVDPDVLRLRCERAP